MIYQISDLYYIKVAPNVFKEVELRINDEDLILVPTENKVEVYNMEEVKIVYLQQEKNKLIEKIKRNTFNNSVNMKRNKYSK